MRKFQIVIDIRGGDVYRVFCSEPDAEAVLVDWDIKLLQPDQPGIVNVPLPEGVVRAFVAPTLIRTFDDLPGSDTQAAIEAGYDQGTLTKPGP